MKKFVAIVAVAMLALVAAGCKKKSSGGSLVLTNLGEQLRPVQGTELDIVTHKIKYKRIGRVNYDQISKKSAEIYAVVVQFEHLLKLKEEKKLPAGLDIAAIIAFGAVAIPDAVKNSVELVKRAKALNPKNDFTGTSAMKAPKAASLLTESVKRLKEAGEKGAELVKKLTKKEGE